MKGLVSSLLKWVHKVPQFPVGTDPSYSENMNIQ